MFLISYGFCISPQKLQYSCGSYNFTNHLPGKGLGSALNVFRFTTGMSVPQIDYMK